ncbi:MULTISPECIES: tRNA uridine-5-carboxymethylaminomethyl(34) synthesis enzyme MnmG [Hallerella]|uniref:tRNA uridine-5-carboxymethylaminomethyl(34) synthesis enzyme MnmG n=1 Tax=Hallerella TaxID=2815788 RepID=UPI0025871752|nr:MULTISPECIES: tRNA uridine-5-carboxymethylaminomethyl(34) synthesis enzyme MnmG [Hallerella]MCI6873720.1 tRNA uridine-5-carboxymethylaminomethyl(34) synthesis enzyme MnmG [Hallerella sp.]MDY5029236.1 tRNA uridine-5-carboxymethylaminomethyl(34) synthesis enzyme MnmG [Hallerella succinigenes]
MSAIQNSFDVVVIGGGHAGIEAAHAAWKIGVKTAMITMELDAIGRMSCNPAVGGVSKGQIVRDIDAMGGLMGLLTDKAGIQFRMLNLSKGPAVWGPRAQCDLKAYSRIARETLENCKGLHLIQGELAAFDRMPNGKMELTLLSGERFETKTLVITSGTFLASKMFTGLETSIGGRVGEPSADALSKSILSNGLRLRRLKTGTPSRLDPSTINFNILQEQPGDENPWPMSDRSAGPIDNGNCCWITRTNIKTHDILRSGFKDSPMFSGRIKGKGPRYCPSIEDKINRFGDKDGHQLFLEPETKDVERVYLNGFSSSLPAEIQLDALHTIQGLEKVRVMQIGYAVEYDSIDATQLYPTFECKTIPGLYFAGQVCGTSGYEEAAGQGMIAGINAALKTQNAEPFMLGRSESYIGVMADDLSHFLLDEPYRMFTSRAEYRLFLRSDNADSRLKDRAHKIGMIDDAQYAAWEARKAEMARVQKYLAETPVTAAEINPFLEAAGQAPTRESIRLNTVLRRPGIDPEAFFHKFVPNSKLIRRDMWNLFAEEAYAGFFARQAKEIEHEKKMDRIKLAPDTDFSQISALSIESRERLAEARPLTVGSASRIPGIRPSDIMVLTHWVENH